MSRRRVLVIPTGVANLASIVAGLSRLDVEPTFQADAAAVAEAEYVVLPGVGAFAAGMKYLQENGLAEPLVRRIEEGKPTLAVCLGLQLLCRESEESPGIKGLGVIDQPIRRFSDQVRVPQLGWNKVVPDDCRLLLEGYAYFANSYRLTATPEGWHVAHAQYDGRFLAALERGAVLACQFHPELSGPYGLELLRRWLNDGAGGDAC
ncbi:MAG TPA: imidazole glycerol phosphate synthase subunit HisH [bacterium]|nr:imidazole glycerol phosphate synthase subunit HisH [bacterium]